ncbi:DDE-type integrase/transposase/recombinase [Streptomyces sp. NBC_00658]|uniref:DDE-type integrase/transposase/recombinase n=1 Tax=Streptomyces sp. NBC_00658 TaxID=2975800 RepID=UPI0038681388
MGGRLVRRLGGSRRAGRRPAGRGFDIASRRVVGWSTADHLRTELVAGALRSACCERRLARPVIFHSDRGCRCTSQQFAALATGVGRPSVRRLR